jgi:alpha-D-ribose 1-methylphosphonate 5-triphosphate synthase subunit PhnH
MIADADVLEGGFTDPVLESQSTFRVLMDAMARPACVMRIEAGIAPPATLGIAAGAVACTLIDADTPYWLDAVFESDALHRWLAFHTGGRRAATMADAVFALVGMPCAMPSFDRFAQGSQDYPDRSATLILQLESLDGGEPFTFEGPGIKERATIAPRGLPANFVEQWNANRKGFPRGVDLVLTAGHELACLPRSARLISAKD